MITQSTFAEGFKSDMDMEELVTLAMEKLDIHSYLAYGVEKHSYVSGRADRYDMAVLLIYYGHEQIAIIDNEPVLIRDKDIFLISNARYYIPEPALIIVSHINLRV